MRLYPQHTLQGHDIAALTLDHLRNHVVDQSVLVPDAGLVEGRLVVLLKDLLENILEATVVCLKDGIFRAHIEWELLVERKLETGVSES